MRALVTGANGFIGRWTLDLLKSRGVEVHAVTTRSGEFDADVEWHQADLLCQGDRIALLERTKPTHLLHLAWYTTHGLYWTSLENLKWLNCSIELAEEFASVGGERIIVAGTCAEYDWSSGICHEYRTPMAPSSFYGSCKLGLFHVLEGLMTIRGMSWAWPRMFHLYGPGEHPDRLVASVLRSLLSGETVQCSHGRQVRDYLYVKDCAEALVEILCSTVEGPINVGSGIPLTIRELVMTIANKIDPTARPRFAKEPETPTSASIVVPDIARLREEVGWKPSRSLSLGLSETADWWGRVSDQF